MPTTIQSVKRAVIGRPRASQELKHQLLPKWMALPVFSSDPLSSVAYATQEMMLVLALAGSAAQSLVMPLAGGVALLLAVVVASYHQTVRAYPHGGGAYIVARDNLGDLPGLTAAGALMVDYTLTVSVSIAAGVAAIVSAAPALADARLAIALGFLALLAVANLRGVREAGTLFAIPTYLFVATMQVMIVVGLSRCLVGGCPQAPPLPVEGGGEPLQALTLFLLLRAFASGATALTGVEAISNGVPAFRYPQSRNAATTLTVMGGLAVTMFLGISYLATATGVTAVEHPTVTSQIARAVFGDGVLFYLVQVVTAAILILAANTAYADFPRLASVLAGDRFMPRQFLARGDRLVFSNGVLVLTGLAALLLIAFGAEVTRLIQLYVVGVFTSFTLSQLGMVRHWLRRRSPGWRRSAAVNAIGGATTAVVLVVVALTKFTHGAWIVIAAVPCVVTLMSRIRRHYDRVSLALHSGVSEPEPSRPNHLVLVFDVVDEPLARALSYARATVPTSLSAIAVPARGADVERRWAELAPDVPLRVLQGADTPGVVPALRQALRDAADAHPDAFTTVVIPETRSESWLEVLRRHRLALRLKAELLSEPSLVVTNVVSPEGGPGPYTIEEPVEHHVVVLVAGVHAATMRALAYAQQLQATSVRALSVSLASDRANRILQEWEDWGVEVPLELVDSPFRELTDTIRAYLREFKPDGRHTIVTAVLPEFIVPRLIQRPLHNQTALAIKAALLFERGVVVTDVPFHLDVDAVAEEVG